MDYIVIVPWGQQSSTKELLILLDTLYKLSYGIDVCGVIANTKTIHQRLNDVDLD